MTLPAYPAIAEESADARRLLDEAQKHDHNRAWESDRPIYKAQASAQMATAHALLAMGGEIATIRAQLDQLDGIRREVAGLTAAVRELAATAEKSADPIAEAARALPEIADAGLSNIATAVESLAANLERPRRGWFRRSVRPEVSA